MNQLTGGSFQDCFQNPVANGYIILQLKQTFQADGYTYNVLEADTDVCTGGTFKIPLDAAGNIIASPAYSVYANDEVSPTSYYEVSVYTENGQLVWGTNAQQVLSSPSPWDVGQWIPNEF